MTAAATLCVAICIILLIAVTCAGVIAMVIAGAKRHRDTLAEVARKYGGEVKSDGLFASPSMRFQHAGRTVLLSYSSEGKDDNRLNTCLSVTWPQPQLRCEVYPESGFSVLRKLIGMQDIEIGSRRFDEEFIITGNDETAIKVLLTPEAQAQIIQLRDFDAGNRFLTREFYLRIGEGVLTVKKYAYLVNAKNLDTVIRLFLNLYDAINGHTAEGIEFMESDATLDKAAPHCIVCGEPLGGDLVSCSGCKTLHHRDCWQYFGGCATYGCGGKQLASETSGGH